MFKVILQSAALRVMGTGGMGTAMTIIPQKFKLIFVGAFPCPYHHSSQRRLQVVITLCDLTVPIYHGGLVKI